MKKRSKIALSVVLAVGLVGGVAAYSKHEGHGFHMKEKISESLQLNEQQSGHLDGLVETMKTSKKSFRGKGFFDMSELIALLEDPSLDKQKAMELVRSKLSSIEQQAEKVINSTAQFTDSLNAEQRSQLQAMVKERSEKRRHHRKEHKKHHKDHSES